MVGIHQPFLRTFFVLFSRFFYIYKPKRLAKPYGVVLHSNLRILEKKTKNVYGNGVVNTGPVFESKSTSGCI